MKYIGVIGGRICSAKMCELAFRAGRTIAESGAVLVCGGMGGIMECACQGACEAGGVTIGILPMDERKGSNPYLTYSIPTGMGEARNSIVVKSSDALLAIGGNYGTLSEIAFALIHKKPVVGLNTWKLVDSEGNIPPIYHVEDPKEAVKILLSELNENF
jgi:uncharacterized protein (TIGR00725 family)